ncbi:MAG: lipopolysaccharide heptosyltransferase II [Limisphaerales bacterium]
MNDSPPSSLPGYKHIIVRGTNWLGDAVMAAPALMRLREKFSDARIALLTPEKLRQLWMHHPAVDEVIAFSSQESVFAIAGRLRVKKFDAALVLPNSPRAALEMFLAGVPVRIGYARPWRRFFLTKNVAPGPDALKMRKRTVQEIKALIGSNGKFGIRTGPFSRTAHQSREYLRLAAAMGADPEPLPPSLFVTAQEVEAVRQKFDLAANLGPIFGMNAGAEYGPAKRWPRERYTAVAREIQKQTNCAWLLFGGKNDIETANYVQCALGEGQSVFNVAGKTSLRDLMSLMKLCRVLVTNDTGPMHVAAALAVPVVAIFGSTSPELTAPLATSGSRVQILASNAPCAPCFLRACPIDFRCMNGIMPAAVVEAVLQCVTA